ncbi:hypothetical protein BDV96DRAFT_561027 [Lophiotrema nucula]|uniref:F-box domain-containing protein n=1 Tax=Lophiotrema nucula TaxID=690887 RepID=A0A6A5ZW38_9PLEO|nr:hypothetical protein BDV96DRAFT_561027 [Lophiotrema nucula]
MVTIDSLPNEILVQVVLEVRRGNPSDTDLLHCLLVSRRWHGATVPVLYGNIAFKNLDLNRFLQRPSLPNCADYVRSFTIRVRRSETPMPGATLEQMLDMASILLPALKNLKSFSLTDDMQLDTNLHTDNSRPVSSHVVVALVNALPSSCQSMELDVVPRDRRNSHTGWGTTHHVCDSVRRVLRRMRDVRIRLWWMCPALFGTTRGGAYTPISAPHLKTLVVSPHGFRALLCDSQDPQFMNLRSTWASITSALERFVEAQSQGLGDAKIHAVKIQKSSINSVCKTGVRTDILARKSFLYPLQSTKQDHFMIRQHDERDLVSAIPSIQTMLEGNLWVNTVGGARLPARVLKASTKAEFEFAISCVPQAPEMYTADEWRTQNPEHSTWVWENEAATGLKLLSGKVVEGEGYLNVEPILESTPRGWKRGRHYYASRLERDD